MKKEKREQESIDRYFQKYFFRAALDNLIRKGEVQYNPETQKYSLTALGRSKSQGNDADERRLQ